MQKKTVVDDGMEKDQFGVFLYKPVNPAKGQSNSKLKFGQIKS